MTQKTATEKDHYLASAEREFQTTLRLLEAYPAEKQDLKASDRSQSALQIAWTLALGRLVVERIVKGEVSPSGLPESPRTFAEVIAAFQKAHRHAIDVVSAMKEEDLNGMVQMPVGPKRMGEVRRGDALWMFLSDQIHHRGQLSVYLRMAGGHVPSIYGPSGDEPWT